MLELLLTGFYIGAIHVLSSPDHLAVLIPLGLMKKKKSWHVGLLWSLGHMIGLIVLGIALFYFKSIVDLSFLNKYNLLYIGVLLIIVGVWIVYKSKNIHIEKKQPDISTSIQKISFSTGVFHGVAGISHLYTLAPTLSMNTSSFFSYFLSFTIGTSVTVIVITYLLYFIPEKVLAKEDLYKKICRWSGFVAIIMGIALLVMFYGDIQIIHHH